MDMIAKHGIAFTQGYKARRAGKHVMANPYDKGYQRDQWIKGWLAAKAKYNCVFLAPIGIDTCGVSDMVRVLEMERLI